MDIRTEECILLNALHSHLYLPFQGQCRTAGQRYRSRDELAIYHLANDNELSRPEKRRILSIRSAKRIGLYITFATFFDLIDGKELADRVSGGSILIGSVVLNKSGNRSAFNDFITLHFHVFKAQHINRVINAIINKIMY